ncbi:MAG TPA: hypothetical protein DCZ48_10010 [Methylococcaceae bacterium]|nr:hypothetical protein [Methylococcaceae bacterium]
MMKRDVSISLFIVLVMLSPFSRASAYLEDQKIIAGWVEDIILSPAQIRFRAKLDTGAKTSSIHAKNVEEFERDGQSWVRFTLPKGLEKKAQARTVELPVARETLIKRHKMDSARRYVVELGFCMNSNYYETEFTLADRGNYIYPVLLGRRFLENKVIVDPGVTHKHSKKLKNIICSPGFPESVLEE